MGACACEPTDKAMFAHWETDEGLWKRKNFGLTCCVFKQLESEELPTVVTREVPPVPIPVASLKTATNCDSAG